MPVELPLDHPDLAHISPDIRHLAIPIGSLFEDPDNVRLHNERNHQANVASLARYGQRSVVVVNANTMTFEAGNGTRAAALALGWKYLAVNPVDDDEETAAAFAIADNRSAELASWNYDRLGAQLAALQADGVALSQVGFLAEELAAIQQTPPGGPDAGGEGPGGDGGAGADDPPESYRIKLTGVPAGEADDLIADLSEALGELASGLTFKAY